MFPLTSRVVNSKQMTDNLPRGARQLLAMCAAPRITLACGVPAAACASLFCGYLCILIVQRRLWPADLLIEKTQPLGGMSELLPQEPARRLKRLNVKRSR